MWLKLYFGCISRSLNSLTLCKAKKKKVLNFDLNFRFIYFYFGFLDWRWESWNQSAAEKVKRAITLTKKSLQSQSLTLTMFMNEVIPMIYMRTATRQGHWIAIQMGSWRKKAKWIFLFVSIMAHLPIQIQWWISFNSLIQEQFQLKHANPRLWK